MTERKDPSMTFGENLKQHRLEKHYSHEQLSGSASTGILLLNRYSAHDLWHYDCICF